MTNSQEPDEAPANVNVDQKIGTVQGGRVAGVEADTINGNVSVVLQTYGTTARAARALVALPAMQAFVGRDRELATVTKALRAHRTVLVHGLGGIGKTTLAAKAIGEMHDAGSFTEGVIWVSEVARAPVEAICDAVARHLNDEGVPKLKPDEKPDAVREMLASRGDVLLVLDHLDEPSTANAVLSRCLPSTASLLVTSRRRHLGFAVDCDTPKLKRADAIALFRERASLDTADPAIDAICKLLGDHPLAISVAAGRIRAEGMSLNSLRERLSSEKSRLRTLRINRSTGRNQNVWASLELSLGDLDDASKRVFTLLAACEGEQTGIELLALICEMEQWACEDHVGDLVARSVVQREGDLVGCQALVRDFGREMLGNALTETQRRVGIAVRHFAERYGSAPAKGATPTPPDLARLESELSNLLGAIRVAAAARDWEELNALLKAIGSPTDGLLGVRGYWRELLEVLRIGIELATANGELAAVTRLKNNAAIVSYKLGEHDDARTLYQESLAIARSLKDNRRVAHTLHNMGVMAQGLGEYEEARSLYAQSLALKTALGDRAGIARTRHEQARIAQKRGEYKEALGLYKQSVDIKRELGDELGVASSEFNVAGVSQVRGAFDDAIALYARLLTTYETLREQEGMASVLRQLGRIAVDQGDYATAEQRLTRSHELATALMHRAGVGDTLFELGRLHLARGNFPESRKAHGECQSIRTVLRDAAGIASAEHELGRVARAMNELENAERLLQSALACRTRLGDRTGVAYSQYELAELALDRRDVDSAVSLLEHALGESRLLGVDPCTARVLDALGRAAALRGARDAAAQYWTESAALFGRLRSPLVAAVQRALASL